MSAPLLSLLAGRGRTGALVVATALATTALVGGGTVVLQSVSSAAAASDTASPETPGSNGRGAERRSDKAQAAGSGKKKDRVAAVPFTCDPSKSHGQNVSAYVHSLPKGPGRGRLVSEVASSDCGKSAGEADDATADAQGVAPEAKKSTPDEPDKAPVDPGKAPVGPDNAPVVPDKAPVGPNKAPVGPDKGSEAGDPAAGKTPTKDKPGKASKAPTPR